MTFSRGRDTQVKCTTNNPFSRRLLPKNLSYYAGPSSP